MTRICCLTALTTCLVVGPRIVRADERDIGAGRHSVGGQPSIRFAYPKADQSGESVPEVAGNVFYALRFRYVAIGISAWLSRPTGATAGFIDALLPIGGTEVGAGLGYGAALLFREAERRVGIHWDFHTHVALNVHAGWDAGVGFALVSERAPSIWSEAAFHLSLLVRHRS